MPLRASRVLLACAAVLVLALPAFAQGTLVLQSDFGLRDGAVASMKGVATGVDPALRIHDLTHEIAPFDIWEAAYRLRQVTPYWPRGTVFVSVVDPGVGTARLGVVARTARGQLLVTPDNGTLTFIAADVAEVREIDLTKHTLPGSERSHTFHGRDVFAYLGARLASGQVRFEDVGPTRGTTIVRLEVTPPRREGAKVQGIVAMIDRPYGNVWTNLPAAMIDSAGFRVGDTLVVRITDGRREVFAGPVPYVESFGHVAPGATVAYLNSLLDLAIAVNQGSFADSHHVRSGPAWMVSVSRGRPRAP
ncbi:MAG: S-adenosyl-l-methionine hydroxide adenosyltransferase family protein [Gemmatimonadota bacterium]|nr:S-adenosyl-l-methionine hydroxide adenosyltransferase family protein [Gemmatimonadota bacterium]